MSDSKEVKLSFLDIEDLMKMSVYDTDSDGVVDVSKDLEAAGVPDGVYYGKENGLLGFYKPTVDNIQDINNVKIDSVSDGDLLRYVNGEVVPVDPVDLREVILPNTVGKNGHALMVEGGKYTLIKPSIFHIDEMQLSSLQNGDAIVYNSSTNKFENKQIQSGGTVIDTINDISDVSTGGATNGQFLGYDGSVWVSKKVDYQDIDNTPSLAQVATTGNYNDLSNKPTIPEAFSGNYNDLTNTPEIPTRISDLVDVNTSSISVGQILEWNGSMFIPANKPSAGGTEPTLLGELSDVNTTGASNGDSLTYENGSWLPKKVEVDVNYSDINDTPNLATVATSGSYNDLTDTPSIPSSLRDLNDVAYLGALQGQVLRHNGTNFTAATLSYNDLSDTPTIPEPISSIGGLNDVNISGISSGQVLQWNGSSFVPATVTSGGGGASTLNELSDVNTSGATNGQFLGYDGSGWKPMSGGLGGGGGSLKIEYVRIQFDISDHIIVDSIQTTDGVGVEVDDPAACRWRIYSNVYKYPPMVINAYSFNGTGVSWTAAGGFIGGEYRTRVLINGLASGNIRNKDEDTSYTRGEPFGNFNMKSTSDPSSNRYSVAMYTLPPDWGINHATAFTGDVKKYGDLWFMLVFGE